MTHSLEPSSSFGSGDSAQRNTWRWRFEDSAGTEVTTSEASAATGFPSQSDAESWVGEIWRDLLEDGVDQVTPVRG